MTAVRLTARQAKTARTAIRLAIDYEKSFIDAHRVKLVKCRGHYATVIPGEYAEVVSKSRALIARFKRLVKALGEYSDAE